MDATSYGRFLDKIEPNVDTGCWEWDAYINPDGYGIFWLVDKQMGTHIASYLHHKGEIPPKWEIDHLCRNRKCVFDQHLEAVPKVVNILRGEGPTAVNARADTCKDGHPFNEESTRINHGSRVCIPCEKAYMRAYYLRNREQLIEAAARNKAKRRRT